MKKLIYLVFILLFVITGCNQTKEDIHVKHEIEVDYPLAENEAGIIKVYKQKIPTMRFIGKNYGSGAHPDWGDAWGGDVFGKIERAAGGAEKTGKLYEDGDSYIGLYYRNAEADAHDGWVGMFAPAGTEVPEGLDYIDFPEQYLGVCWIYGTKDEVYDYVWQCPDKITDAGMEIRQPDEHGYNGFFERDQCPRYTTPDENGKLIIDYCYFVK